jgi:hypothetical protein
MRFLRSLLALVLLCPWTLTAQTLPALPRTSVATAMPALGPVRKVPAGADLQAVLDAAPAGTVLEFPCDGTTYTGNFTLPVKSGSAWTILRPACFASLPAEGTRITPAVAAQLTLPRFVTPNGQPAIQTALGAHHYRLVGLDVTIAPAWTGTNYGLIAFGTNDDGGQTTLASIAHDLIVDRSYVHGSPTQNVRRGVALNSATSAVIDSYLSEIHEEGSDAQAIAGWNGPGPYKIVNNHLEASTENILFGGGDPSVQGMIPGDIEIRRNHVFKQPSWRGGRWSIKNLLELKNAQRVLIEGNVFENNWEHAQDGSAMQLQSTNQSGTAPWSQTADVTIRLNILRNVGGGIVMAAAPQVYPATHAARFLVEHNLIDGVNVPGFAGTGRTFSLFQDVADVTIRHNTVPQTTNSAITFDGLPGQPAQRLVVRDNLMAGGAYGLIGSGTGIGTLTLERWAPGAVFLGNVLTTDYPSEFPPGNFYPVPPAGVGFVSLSDGDYRLAPTSPYRGKASDGTDPGADLAALTAATAGVVSGTGPMPAAPPSITLAQLRAAVTAIDKVVSSAGRENAATKAALAPVAVYLHALLGATP